MKLVINLDRVANSRRHCEGNSDNGNDGDELDYEEVAEILGTKRRIMMIAKILGAFWPFGQARPCSLSTKHQLTSAGIPGPQEKGYSA